jgi:SAM-dependent methyltransferase
MAVKTYTTMRTNPLEFARDAYDLWRIRTRNLKEHAGNAAANARRFDAEVTRELGSGLAGKKVLIIGPGQTLREWWAFSSLGADVIGIDLDVVPVGFDLPAYVNLLRKNGPMRFTKTVGRKVLGIDRAFEHALAQALGVPKLRPGRLIAADATNLPFASGEFDVVYSFSVFEHLDAPAAVMKEITRVLKPGGFARISVHLYASEGGCHDLRIFAGKREGIPVWAHLRPAHQHTVQESCYLNKLRTADFEKLFTEQWPGVRFELDHHQGARDGELRSALAGLRAAGELGDYTDEELLSVNLLARWKRPEVARG